MENESNGGPGVIQGRSKEGEELYIRFNEALDNSDGNELLIKELVDTFETTWKRLTGLVDHAFADEQRWEGVAGVFARSLEELQAKLEFLSKGIVLSSNELHETKNNYFRAHTTLENSINSLSHSHEVCVADLNLACARIEAKLDALALDFEKDQTRDYKRIKEMREMLDAHLNAGVSSHGEPGRGIPKMQEE